MTILLVSNNVVLSVQCPKRYLNTHRGNLKITIIIYYNYIIEKLIPTENTIGGESTDLIRFWWQAHWLRSYPDLNVFFVFLSCGRGHCQKTKKYYYQ